MLDLDQLASLRAGQLQQPPEIWQKALWSEGFQQFSASMSDGEVEQVVAWCPSVQHLQALIRFLAEASRQEGLTPFPLLLDRARQAQVAPEEWIRSMLPMDANS